MCLAKSSRRSALPEEHLEMLATVKLRTIVRLNLALLNEKLFLAQDIENNYPNNYPGQHTRWLDFAPRGDLKRMYVSTSLNSSSGMRLDT